MSSTGARLHAPHSAAVLWQARHGLMYDTQREQDYMASRCSVDIGYNAKHST